MGPARIVGEGHAGEERRGGEECEVGTLDGEDDDATGGGVGKGWDPHELGSLRLWFNTRYNINTLRGRTDGGTGEPSFRRP